MDDNPVQNQEGEDLKKLEEELKNLETPQPVPAAVSTPPVSVPPAPVQEQMPSPLAPQPTLPTEPKSSKILMTAIGLLVLSTVGIGAYLFGTSRGGVTPTPTPYVSPTPTPDSTADWEEIMGKTFSIKIPPTWKENSRLATYQNDLCFSTERETNQEAGGDFTPGLADLCISIEPSLVNFSGLESSSSKIISLAGEAAEQRMGYGGVAGSVYMVKTILKSTNGNDYVFTLTTQDESLKQTFQEEYDQILSTFKLLEASPTPSVSPKTLPTTTPSATPQL